MTLATSTLRSSSRRSSSSRGPAIRHRSTNARRSAFESRGMTAAILSPRRTLHNDPSRALTYCRATRTVLQA